MKILKYLFFLLLIMVIGGSIYFGTLDGNYDIANSKIIPAPAELVFNQINDLRASENWGPWKTEDSTMTFSYAEKTSGEGASYSWKGIMDGAMTTTKVIPNKEILQDLTLHTPVGERSPKVYWTFEETPEGTKATYGMKGEHTLIDKAFYGVSGYDFDAEMSKMHTKALAGVEREALKAMEQFEVNVDGITKYGGGFYMYNTAASKMSDMASKMGPMFGQVSGFIEANGLPSSGMPFTIYHEIDETAGTVIFSTGIPVREQITMPNGSNVLCGYMPPLTALKTTLKGDYKNLAAAYAIAAAYMTENELLAHPTARMFEVYTIDPGLEPNPAKWVTEIYMPMVSPATPFYK